MPTADRLFHSLYECTLNVFCSSTVQLGFTVSRSGSETDWWGVGGGGVKVMGFCFSWSEFSFKETYVDIDAVNSAAGDNWKLYLH